MSVTTFEKYEEVLNYGRYPFRVVTMNGHSVYISTFHSKKDVEKLKRAIITQLEVHKKLKPMKPS